MEATLRIRTELLNKKGKCPILVDVHLNGSRIRIPSGRSVSPENWMPARPNYRPKKDAFVHTSEPGSKELNFFLNNLLSKISQIDIEAGHNGEKLTTELLKQRLAMPTRAVRKKKEPVTAGGNPLTLIDYIKDWQARNKSRKSPNTIRKFNQVFPHLEKFWPGAKPSDVTEEFIDNYVAFLLGTTDLVNATIGKHINAIKKAVQQARIPADWIENHYTQSGPGIDLYYEEVMALYNAKIEDPEVSLVRDLFVFMCFVGLRYSDLKELRPEDVKEISVDGQKVKVIGRIQIKSTAPVHVPLAPVARQIWDKYQGQFPVPTGQTMNEKIKVAARIAKLTRSVGKVKFKGPNRIEATFPLHRKITCHVARHTAASLILEASGGDLGLAQSVLGVTASTITTYAKEKNVRLAKGILNAWANLTPAQSEPAKKKTLARQKT